MGRGGTGRCRDRAAVRRRSYRQPASSPRHLDAASTALMSALASNDEVTQRQAVRCARPAASSVDYFTITLEKARVASVDLRRRCTTGTRSSR